MFTESEREYLLEVLVEAHTQMLHELHHSDTRTFEEGLKRRIALNELLQKELRTINSPGHPATQMAAPPAAKN